MMNARWTHALVTPFLALALGAGCASPSEDASRDDSAESALTQASDSAIEGKLRGILEGVTFTSEADSPYVVFEGDTVSETRLTTALVRKKLQTAVKARSSTHRDIVSASCRASRLSISEAIAAGSAADADADPHDRQLMLALATMRSQLAGVVGFTFGTNASGDQDENGPVLFVYVGISKTTKKLIAIMTEAVFT